MELAWRDFYTCILAAFPRVSMGRPFSEKCASVKWEESKEMLKRWQVGKTVVQSLMRLRQMNTMGWMHNRMRLISVMFLCKDVMIDWRLGERYFIQTLIDGDLASNNGDWQWCASTDTDAAPNFRLFNPYPQHEGWPIGCEFVPELKNLKGPDLQNPPAEVVDKVGYPRTNC